MAILNLDTSSFECEQTSRTFLDKEHDQYQYGDLGQDGSPEGLDDFADNSQAHRPYNSAGQLAYASQHDSHEGIDDIALAQIRTDVADLRQSASAKSGDPGAKSKRVAIH